MDKELLKDYGIDFDKGLKNCIGDLTFYKRILSMFLDDQCFPKAKAAYMEGDKRELFSRMHELKGISGNAALAELYYTTIPLVELLRLDNSNPAEAEVKELFVAAEAAYNRTCEGIRLYIAEK